jgi:hypothetical protein
MWELFHKTKNEAFTAYTSFVYCMHLTNTWVSKKVSGRCFLNFMLAYRNLWPGQPSALIVRVIMRKNSDTTQSDDNVSFPNSEFQILSDSHTNKGSVISSSKILTET